MPVGRRKPPELPDDPKLIAWWEKKLDPARTTVREFIELFKVPTKRVVRGGRAMTQFVCYPFQAEALAIIEGQWDRGEGGKYLGGKARQEGMTTFFLLLWFERFLRGGGGTWNYFSYDDPKSIEAFALLLKLRRQIPEWVYAFLVNQSAPGKHDGGGIWTKKSHRCLELSFPGDRGASLLQCATAGGEFSGSGSAPRGVGLDEFTKYPKAVKVDHTGISEGWADVPGNVFAYWGTGQGREEYAEMFEARWRVKDSPDGYVAHFRSWLGHPDRSVTFTTTAERDAFAATVGKEKLFGPREEEALVHAGATLEELHWRRRKLSGPSFKYDLVLFARENPLVPADMFVSESGSVFQVEILRTHDAAAEARERSARVGDFVEKEDDVVFVDNRAGSWVLYEERRDDLFVVWGADSASGKSKQTGSSKEADFADAKFKEAYTGRTLARFSAHLEGRKFGEELLNAARYFRRVVPKKKDDAPKETGRRRRLLVRAAAGRAVFARGFPEVNNESGAAMMLGMERYCEERGLRFADFVMFQQHPILSDGKRPDPSPGWRTTRSALSGGVSHGSKGILIDVTKLFVAEVGDYRPAIGTPFDAHTLAQMYKYERDDKGATEAASGFDDAVSSEMLCLTARDYALHDGSMPSASAVPLPPRPSEGPKMRYYPDKDHEPEKTTDPVLGRQFSSMKKRRVRRRERAHVAVE